MRKLIPVVLVLAEAPAFADGFGARMADAVTNPVVVAGGKYLTEDPGVRGSRVQFMLTANVPGFRVMNDLYIGGVGVGLNTVVPGLGEAQGAGVSIPAVTYFVKGSQFVVQAGYGWDLSSSPNSGGIYAGVGFSFSSSATVKAKRAAKEAKKAKENK